MNFEIHLVSLKTVINLCADCIGTFFVIWTIIDGLDWRTYIYVVVFCGFVPLFLDFMGLLIFRLRKVWVKISHH
eukprot:gene22691-30973_t